MVQERPWMYRSVSTSVESSIFQQNFARVLGKGALSSFQKQKFELDAPKCRRGLEALNHDQARRRGPAPGRQAVLFHARGEGSRDRLGKAWRFARWPEYRFQPSGRQPFKRQDGYFIIRALY